MPSPAKSAFPRRVFRLATFFFLATATLAADKPVARPSTLHLTLEKAIELALAKNFTLEVERFAPQIARQRVTQELGRFDPVLELSASRAEDAVRDIFGRRSREGIQPATAEEIALGTFSGLGHFLGNSVEQTARAALGIGGLTSWGTRYDLQLGATNTDPLDGFGERWQSDLTFSVRQPLLQGAGTDANLASLRIARNNVFVSDWQLRQRLIDTITDTIATYNDLHLAQESLVVARGFRDLARQLVADNKKRVEVGVLSPLDVTTAEAEAAAREESVIVAERRVKDQANFLKQLITRDLASLLDIRVEILPPSTPAFFSAVRTALREALELRPDYRQARLEIERRNITLAFAKDAALPQVDLQASLSLLGLDNDPGTSLGRAGKRDRSGWSVGALFSVPIPNRDGRGGVLAAQLSAGQALVNLQRLEQQIVVEVDNANGAVLTARERIESTRESLRLARESLAAGEERLRVGKGTTFEVLELQKKLAEAQIARLRARADFNKAVAEYHRRIGTTLRVHRVSIEEPGR